MLSPRKEKISASVTRDEVQMRLTHSTGTLQSQDKGASGWEGTALSPQEVATLGANWGRGFPGRPQEENARIFQQWEEKENRALSQP